MVYKLSDAADQDIENLFEYGINRFGVAQAKHYIEGLILHLQRISEHPLHYQSVGHLRDGYRRSVYGKHAVYFVITDTYVHIVRILRAEDLSKAFTPT